MPVESEVLDKAGAKILKSSRSLCSFSELNFWSIANVMANVVTLFDRSVAIAASVVGRS